MLLNIKQVRSLSQDPIVQLNKLSRKIQYLNTLNSHIRRFAIKEDLNDLAFVENLRIDLLPKENNYYKQSTN